MNLTVKICGLSTEATMDAALDAGADMVGLNFFPKSPRFISLEQAARLAEQAQGRAEVVALTVDMDDAGLAAIVETVGPDWLQLHGKETPERALAIRKRFGRQVMKAIGVSQKADLGIARDYEAIADRLLLDAKPPEGALLPGGNGAPFDWSLLQDFESDIPWLLSGGLAPGNVGEALMTTGATGVDVSSGVETAPGQKDPGLIRAFIANARTAASGPHGKRRAS